MQVPSDIYSVKFNYQAYENEETILTSSLRVKSSPISGFASEPFTTEG